MLKNCFPLPLLPTLYKTSPLLQRKEPPQEFPGSPVVKSPHFHCRVCRLHPGWRTKILQISVQFGSVAQSCPTLCDPMNRSTPGLPVHHQLPEPTQTHVHQVGDAIQPSHPLSSPSPPAPNPSQHQGLFKWVSSSHQVAKILEFQLQHQSFQWTPRTYILQDGLVGSPCSPRDSQESSPAPQFKSINFSGLQIWAKPKTKRK